MFKKSTKLDRETKRGIQQVLGKYIDRGNKYMLPVIYTAAGTLTLTALAIDVMGGAGMASLTLSSVGLPTAFTLGGGFHLYTMRTREREMRNGQKIIAGEVVAEALDKMDMRLRHAFIQASQPNATARDKSALQFVIDDVQIDIQKLSPAFRVVSETENDTYQLTVETRRLPNGRTENVTLAQKLAEMAEKKPAALPKPVSSDKPEPVHPPKKSGGFRL